MTFNPKYCNSNLYGTSDLAAVELEISQYILASIHNNSLLENQARPSGILTYKGAANDITQDTVDSIKETLRSSLSGASNAGNATFLSGDFDWKQLSESIKDMDFATLKNQTATAVYNALKIPLPMVSPDNMTLANMETAKVNFYDNTILPLTRTIYDFLGSMLLERYPNSENLELTYDEACIEALEPRQVDNTLKLSQSGVLTVNEIRSQLGYEDLEGGDTLYQPMGLAPIASDVFTDDNRQTPSQEKTIFIKTMKEAGYSDEDIKHWTNN
jgi:HK97 family phage portal protein